MKKIKVRTFHQADPVGVVPGGVDTFIRGIVKWAPDDLEFSVVGMSTDPGQRPVGQWTRCDLGRRQFDFYPVFAETNLRDRSKVPLSVRLMANAWRRRAEVLRGFDVAEVHRIEPLFLMKGDPRPKSAFFHQDMSVLASAKADIRWKSLPQVYFWAERQVVPGLSSAYCVREEGAQILRRRFPQITGPVDFVPTWYDPEIFTPAVHSKALEQSRAELRRLAGWAASVKVLVTVGRLDTQKDPMLLLDAFELLARQDPEVRLAYIGDGVLRSDLERAVAARGLQSRVALLGLKSAREIAEILRGSDVFVLSSAYEGMPMALMEAQGCGLPAVTTDVGEVRKIVTSASGVVVDERSAPALAEAANAVLGAPVRFTPQACTRAVAAFQPQQVLAPVYENYRRLGSIASIGGGH